MELKVFEHEKIFYQGINKKPGFESRHFRALCSFHDQRDHSKYYSILRDGIKFNQHVGVISVGNLTIEILPKTDQSSDKNVWRDVLIKMLKETGEINVNTISNAKLKIQPNHILELYIDLFITEVEGLCRKGLIRKYRRKEENNNVLRGKLLFTQQIKKNLFHKERFYVSRHVYDTNEKLNCILRKAILLLSSLSLPTESRSRINKLKFDFPDLPEIFVTDDTLKKINWERKNSHYRASIDIAKLLLLNYHPDISVGQENVVAILFDMNQLWEKFILKRLKKEESENFKVQSQRNKLFWQTRKIRPDLIFENNGVKTILDTKWKLIRDSRPSEEDLRQIFTYNLYFDCKKGIMLYPGVGQKSHEGVFHHGNSVCIVQFVDILENQGGKYFLSPSIGRRIVELGLMPTTVF